MCAENYPQASLKERHGGVTMPEAGGSNIEVAHHLSEHNEPPERHIPFAVELAEAIVLSIVAITTAWSGYQAALWTGHQSKLYGLASKQRVQAARAAASANYERLYDATTVAQWLQAETDGKKKLADLYERRFLPEFRPAFEAWKKADPLNNANAPPGPFYMPEYRNSKAEEADSLSQQSADTFEQGDEARHHADDYVRETVMLATVLLLTAISQRFKIRSVRIGLIVVAGVLLSLSIYQVVKLPRI
jgi:hypothetical protein